MAVLTQSPSQALPWWRGKRGRRRLQVVLATAVLWIVLTGLMIPFFWMVSTALKDEGDVFLQPPKWIPSPVVWDNFHQAMTQIPFMTFFTNSCIVTGLTMVGVLFSSSMVAYAFAR